MQGDNQRSPNTGTHFSPHTSETSTLTPSFPPRYGQEEPEGQGFTWQQNTSSATTRSTSETDVTSSHRMGGQGGVSLDNTLDYVRADILL